MKALIKLLIAGAIIHAAVRGGLAVADYYQLKDEARQLVIFGAKVSPDELAMQIVAKAAARGVPLQPENVRVEREGYRTTAHGTYTQDIELLPRYRRAFAFTFDVEGISMGASPQP